MQQKLLTHLKKIDKKQYRAIAIVVLLVIILIALVITLTKPKRSVAAYCKVYTKKKYSLATQTGIMPSSVLPFFLTLQAMIQGTLSRRLIGWRLAPTQIEPQVVAMKDIWVKMKNDPTDVLSSALNGLPAESAVTQWTQQHCGS